MQSSEFAGYADIIFFAILAGFIFFKLRDALGRKDDSHEQMKQRMQNRKEAAEKVVSLREKDQADKKPVVRPTTIPEPDITDEKLAKTLAKMKTTDPNFTVASFLQGANTAYEMILNAYQKEDTSTLKNLLSDELYNEFSAEMKKEHKQGKHTDSTLVSVSSEITDAAYGTDNTAVVTVTFTTEQINVTRDDKGKIIAGDPGEINVVTDSWEFERNMRSSDPNWKITAT